MRTIKLFGGPAHGRIMTVPDYKHRVMAEVQNNPPTLCSSLDTIINYVPVSTCTYYVREYSEVGFTEAGARVRRSLWIGQYEDADLFPHERYELIDALSQQPWKWAAKPNFLTQFDQWFEYTLAEIGWKQPKVGYR